MQRIVKLKPLLSHGIKLKPHPYNHGIPCVRMFSKKAKAPDEYYDESVEDDKEFFDIITSLKKENGSGSLRTLTTLNKPVKKWDDYVHGGLAQDSILSGQCDKEATSIIEEAVGNDIDVDIASKEEEIYDNTFSDVPGQGDARVISHFSDTTGTTDAPFIPSENYNYSIPDYESTNEDTHNFLEDFIPNTAPEKHSMHTQGLRACPGKRQRHGKSRELRCHLIDLDALSVMDVPTLKRFVTDDGEILGKRITGLCAKCQRAVATNIKHARNMGMMPHLGQFVLRDGKPQHVVTDFHETVVVAGSASDGGSNAKVHVTKVKAKTVVV